MPIDDKEITGLSLDLTSLINITALTLRSKTIVVATKDHRKIKVIENPFLIEKT